MNIQSLLNLKAYVINMPNEEENYVSVKKELNSHGFVNVYRWVSYDARDEELLNSTSVDLGIKRFQGSPQQHSLALAHLNILQELLNSKEEEVLIFEDDIIFHTDFQALLPTKLADIPAYNILYLGSLIPRNKDNSSNFVVKDSGIFTTHAYVINRKAAQFILNECKTRGGIAIDVMYYAWFKNTEFRLVALINTPYTSSNVQDITTNNEDWTGLIFQRKRKSTVHQANDVKIIKYPQKEQRQFNN